MVVHRFTLTLGILVTLSLSLAASGLNGAEPSSRVPSSAQSKISATIGSDIPRYYARTAYAGFTLANSSHDFVTDFTSQGVEVKSGDGHWGFALLGYGYGDALTTVSATSPQASANRVEYRRRALTEWYVNGPAGLEQGFTINERPLQTGHEPLTIALSLSGDLDTAVDQDGKGLSLNDASGQVSLRYAGLTAYDAAGRELRAWLEIQGQQVQGQRLLLHVDDAGARYPVVVDPTVQLGKLSASDGTTGSWFGYSIAISGSTIVIGAPQATIGSNTYQGAAYVFVEPKAGWTNMPQTAKLTASDGAAYNYFGAAVSIDSTTNTVVVGSFDAAINSVLGQGAAYVYVEPVSGWTNSTETAKLTASDGAMDNFLGYSVSVSGGTVVVGAPHGEVGGNYDQGAAYVYVEPVSGWASTTETAKLTSNGADGDQFGQSVSINVSTVAVGAPYAEVGGNFSEGAAYVFVEPSGGWSAMTPTAELTVSGGSAYEYFGVSIATSGSTVVAGASGANSFAGAAFVFVEPAGGWANMTQTAELTSSTGVAGDLLGSSVAISGNTVVAGAEHALIGADDWGGAAYLFVMPAGGWATMTQSSRLVVSHGSAYQDFGVSVGLSGNIVAIGGYGVASYTGAGYVFGPSTALHRFAPGGR
jgi:hypothetical protein